MAKISQLEIGVISVKTPLQAERCWSPPVLAHESVVKLPVIFVSWLINTTTIKNYINLQLK